MSADNLKPSNMSLGMLKRPDNEQLYIIRSLFLVQNNVTSFTTVLIFGIFCPPRSAEVENGVGIFQDDQLDALLGAVFKRSNDLGYSYE